MDGGRNRTWMAKTMPAAHNTGQLEGRKHGGRGAPTFFHAEVKDFGTGERVWE